MRLTHDEMERMVKTFAPNAVDIVQDDDGRYQIGLVLGETFAVQSEVHSEIHECISELEAWIENVAKNLSNLAMYKVRENV